MPLCLHAQMAAVRQTKSSGSLEPTPPSEQQQQQQQAGSSAVPLGWPQPGPSPPAAPPLAPAVERAAAVAAASAAPTAERPAAEERGRGRGAAKALLERMSADPSGSGGGAEAAPEAAAAPVGVGPEGPFASSSSAASSGELGQRSKRVSFSFGTEAPMAVDSSPTAVPPLQLPGQAPGAGQLRGQTLAAFSAAAAAGGGGGGSGGGGSGASKVGPITDPKDLEQLMRRMHFRSNKGLGPGKRCVLGVWGRPAGWLARGAVVGPGVGWLAVLLLLASAGSGHGLALGRRAAPGAAGRYRAPRRPRSALLPRRPAACPTRPCVAIWCLQRR